uniref:Death domain-associated protein 6 n=1 Tax=Scophthalmus maximus TaxID=52904 RepID=A0A8D3B4V0_SCOMX
MAVAPAWMADKIIVLDDDEEDSPRPSCAAPASSPEHRAKRVSSLKAQQPAPTHITQSPFATAKKHTHVLKAENERLFTEFVEHCSALTQDCPEVLSFLQTKHAKASPDYLSSVEFRNALGRCLTRAQHAVKRRQSLVKEGEKPAAAEDEQPSTSGLQEDKEEEEQEEAKKAKRASRKQIAYLENLLKVYNDEISRLQQAELSLDDLGAEDSKYIQEHKLKRKMMKIYEKLCELKGCNILTGRVIEQRIPYKSTRYPEINRRIERYINSPEAQRNPPDYQDVLQQVLRANERHKLCLSRKQLNQMALDAFRETGSQMQERRHLDLVYNFGSQLTDHYRPATDPALSDPSLQRKLRSNREVALSRLEEVITKFSVKQEDTEEKERRNKEVNGVAKGEEETVLEEEEQEEEEEDDDDDDDEEDDSSDPDIEEEIQASAQQDGPGESGVESTEVNIPLDMGVFCCNSPQAVRAQTPPQDLVSSSQSTPPPKKNKVNVATQCDPDEIIVLSDSE